MKEPNYRPQIEKLIERMAIDIENYHHLVHQGTKTFSWKIFAGYLIARGWMLEEEKTTCKWEKTSHEYNSMCGYTHDSVSDYCPDCGLKVEVTKQE